MGEIIDLHHGRLEGLVSRIPGRHHPPDHRLEVRLRLGGLREPARDIRSETGEVLARVGFRAPAEWRRIPGSDEQHDNRAITWQAAVPEVRNERVDLDFLRGPGPVALTST